jgi:hypothetical protein
MLGELTKDGFNVIYDIPFNDEAQAALFKDPARTAL